MGPSMAGFGRLFKRVVGIVLESNMLRYWEASAERLTSGWLNKKLVFWGRAKDLIREFIVILRFVI